MQSRIWKVLVFVVSCLCVSGITLAEYGEENKVIKVKPFNPKQVKLLDGPFSEARERDKQYLHALDADRLLHMFRVTAGLESTAEPLGGWEDPGCEVRGHTLGHYLTACAKMYAGTFDYPLKNKADKIVAELWKCQEACGKKYNDGYLFAFPESFFDRVDDLKPVWVPWYTCHKIMAGLLDMYVYCGNQQALEICLKMAAWIKFRTDRLDEAHMQRTLDLEFGGMPEVLADLHAVTGNPDHLMLARRFDHKRILDPLSRQEDHLKGLHVNTQIPKIVGAAREYEMTGEKYYHEIATYFWDQVTGARCYATGGTSNFECWRTDPYKLASELSVESQETCCTYNMLKLTMHLFCWNPEARYMDYYERALFNGILATQSPENGMMMYYVAMKPGHFKVFNTPNDSFWCCTGTGMENHAKYNEAIYLNDDKSLYINLFIASQLLWADKGIRLLQETLFPEEGATLLTFKTAAPVYLPLRIRIPYWATRGVSVEINGQEEAVKAEPSSYLTLERTWKNGDTVRLSFPMRLHLHRMWDDPNLAAVMYGPLVLAGALGSEKFTKDMQYNKGQRDQHHAPSIEVPSFVVESEDLGTWIKPVKGKSLTFKTINAGRPEDVTLVPFHRLFDQRYSVYWRFYTEQEWESAEAERKEQEAREAARLKALAERSISTVEIGDKASEEAHHLEGKQTRSGLHLGKAWRDASPGGWFSYEMAVDPDRPMVLLCTYWGDDVGRTFKVMVDGKEIAVQNLDRNVPGKFFDQEYPVPPELTRGKSKVVVRFEGLPEKMAGGVFGLAMLN